jgi:hypothetical protein
MVPVEQRIYARWLDRATRAGMWLLIAAFAAYTSGVLEPQVALERLPELTGTPAGWGALAALQRGESASLLAVALLALVTVVCYLRILPIHWRRGERLMAAMIAAQLVVLLAAASGVLAGGH